MSNRTSAAPRRFPLSERTDLATVADSATGPNRITDLTHRPRMGVRGEGTPDWCARNALPFPGAINAVAAAGGLRIARLGRFELLVVSETDAPLPDSVRDLPRGVYSGYREDGWAWFRMEGPQTLRALASLTSIDLRPVEGSGDRVVQTRLGGLDAVLVLSGPAGAQMAEIFVDIASSLYLVDVFRDRCPEFMVLRLAGQ